MTLNYLKLNILNQIKSNQIDKEGADPQKVLTGLMSYDILTEEFGGQVQCAKVSAKSGEGIDELLEKVLLQVRSIIKL